MPVMSPSDPASAGRWPNGGGGHVVRPVDWDHALELYANDPDLVAICGGTDLMVEINFDRRRPQNLLDLTHIGDLSGWDVIDGSTIRLGAAVSYSRIIAELPEHCPALVAGARTIGSPQIRNRGTVGGNLATASPAGDCHPALLATGATIEAASVRGPRLIDIDDYFVGPKQQALADDELIRAVHIPIARGPQQFSKIGPRNAMVIATASFALALDCEQRRVGCGIGSAGPVPLRAADAERELETVLDDLWEHPAALAPDIVHRFGEQVAAAASPIDDVRGTAGYRRHALRVLARRSLTWAWGELVEQTGGDHR